MSIPPLLFLIIFSVIMLFLIIKQHYNNNQNSPQTIFWFHYKSTWPEIALASKILYRWKFSWKSNKKSENNIFPLDASQQPLRLCTSKANALC